MDSDLDSGASLVGGSYCSNQLKHSIQLVYRTISGVFRLVQASGPFLQIVVVLCICNIVENHNIGSVI